MPRKQESVGKALRRALGEEVVFAKVMPRKTGVSYLMNERRLRTFEMIFNEPGIHLRELQRMLGIPLQSLRWHVKVLTESGLVKQQKFGRRVVLYSPMSTDQHTVANQALMRQSKYAPIVDFIEARGEASVKELKTELGTYQQLVSSRLRILVELGIVEGSGRGVNRRYRLVAGLQRRSEEDSGELKKRKDELLTLLSDQGLVPRVMKQSGWVVTVVVDRGPEEMELNFNLRAD